MFLYFHKYLLTEGYFLHVYKRHLLNIVIGLQERKNIWDHKVLKGV